MFFPVHTEVVFLRWPWVNFVIIGLAVLGFLAVNLFEVLPWELVEAMVLGGGSGFGWIGHVFLHAGFWHLFGNMVFLWVFGNAVNERMGWWAYSLFFLSAGMVSGGVHLLVDGSPAIGASGAINGVVGLYLVLYPLNRVSCFYLFLFKGGTFHLTGYLLIGFWFLLDLFGAFTGFDTTVAYWAHIGGFLYGLAVGAVLMRTGWLHVESYDNPDLLTLLKLNRPEPKPATADILMPGEVAFDCPDCGSYNRVRETELKSQVRCWNCRGSFGVE